MASPTKAALPQDSNGPWVVAATWVMTGLATVFVVLRFYCRIFRSRSFAWDDQAMLGAWTFLVVQTAVATYNVRLGMGQHVYNVDPARRTELAMVSNLATVPAVLAISLAKASAGLSLLRLLEKWWLRLVVQMIIVTTVLAMMGIPILTLVQCAPISKNWDVMLPGVCWAPDVVPRYSTAVAVYSGVMDILLALIPWPIIMRLQMNIREKLGVAMALASIVFAGISSFATATTISTLDSADATYDAASLIVFGTAETTVTMIAACIPVLRVLVRDVQKSYLRSRSAGRGTQPEGRRGSDSFSEAGYSKSVTQVRRLSEDAQFSMPVMQSVVVQEKSWAVTYSPATEWPPAATLLRAVGARQSIWSPPSPRSSAASRSPEGPVSPISISDFPRVPPSAWRHTVDQRVHPGLSPSVVSFDDDASRCRSHGDKETVEHFV